MTGRAKWRGGAGCFGAGMILYSALGEDVCAEDRPAWSTGFSFLPAAVWEPLFSCSGFIFLASVVHGGVLGLRPE